MFLTAQMCLHALANLVPGSLLHVHMKKCEGRREGGRELVPGKYYVMVDVG